MRQMHSVSIRVNDQEPDLRRSENFRFWESPCLKAVTTAIPFDSDTCRKTSDPGCSREGRKADCAATPRKCASFLKYSWMNCCGDFMRPDATNKRYGTGAPSRRCRNPTGWTVGYYLQRFSSGEKEVHPQDDSPGANGLLAPLFSSICFCEGKPGAHCCRHESQRCHMRAPAGWFPYANSQTASRSLHLSQIMTQYPR